VPGDKLTITDLAALQKLPAFEVSFQVPMATLMGALKRTDLLPEEIWSCHESSLDAAVSWRDNSELK